MDGRGEGVARVLLHTGIVDTDLGVGDTTTESRLGVRLVLAVPVALVRTATHFVGVVVFFFWLFSLFPPKMC